jgi:uncharacterized damage-inducible protein DinB
MDYGHVDIPTTRVPAAAFPFGQHVLDTYASETNKVAAVWRGFTDADLEFRPHPRSMTVGEVLRHQLLSERRFFAEFLGCAEPAATDVVPALLAVETCVARLVALAGPRLDHLAQQPEAWWLEEVAFFDVRRSRVWVVWRRLLHTAHHRTQLSVYLRLLDRPVPPTYGPTADATWSGADPTTSVDAAQRGSGSF